MLYRMDWTFPGRLRIYRCPWLEYSVSCLRSAHQLRHPSCRHFLLVILARHFGSRPSTRVSTYRRLSASLAIFIAYHLLTAWRERWRHGNQMTSTATKLLLNLPTETAY